MADGQAALNLSAELTEQNCRLEKIYGDQAYNGVFAEGIKYLGLKFEKASRSESQKGFVPVAKRWRGRPCGCRTDNCMDKFL